MRMIHCMHDYIGQVAPTMVHVVERLRDVSINKTERPDGMLKEQEASYSDTNLEKSVIDAKK